MTPIIEAAGMFGGDRMARLSDAAKLHWPYIFLSSNGFGRIELNHRKFLMKAFAGFDTPPSEKILMGFFREYQDAFLLFIYRGPDGRIWGQWDTSEKWLPRHKTAEDQRTPAPDPAQYRLWKEAYIASRPSSQVPYVSTFSENFQKFPTVGVGVGVVEVENSLNTVASVVVEAEPENNLEREILQTFNTPPKSPPPVEPPAEVPRTPLKAPSYAVTIHDIEIGWPAFETAWLAAHSCRTPTPQHWHSALQEFRMATPDERLEAIAGIPVAVRLNDYAVMRGFPDNYLRNKNWVATQKLLVAEERKRAESSPVRKRSSTQSINPELEEKRQEVMFRLMNQEEARAKAEGREPDKTLMLAIRERRTEEQQAIERAVLENNERSMIRAS